MRISVACGLAAALLLLALHVYVYRFLCDDAFISFRYARNLALGHGLVFNPGFEHVEGYSNFLWVLLNSGLYRLGVSPETGSLAVSWAATLGLWLLVVAFALREPLEPGREWTALVAPIFLAANRSFAVWASSGLETRLFELLVVAGVLSLIGEVEHDAPGRRRLSPWLFGLATLTRPDGLLISATAFSAAGVALARHGRFEPRRFLLSLLPYALLVGGLFAFRLAYYGSWLPNTYYAKVGGRMWWSAGADYFMAFILEYSAWLWLPFIAIGVARLVRGGRFFTPLLFAAIIVPHALYVAAIGGDHFEYRPLDLYLPFLFLLVGAGARALLTVPPPTARSRRGRPRELPAFPMVSPGRNVAVAASLAIVLLAGIELPWQSHAQFPARYLPGFPGGLTAEPERVGFMAPDRNLLFRIPGLRAAAKRHVELLRSLSIHFVGLRQEEHARFLATVAPEGRALRALVQRGLLPQDTHIATGSVGAIPYYSDLRTLDRLGLTDSAVARAAPQQQRMMAHDRSASFAYGREQGVDLWAAHDVHFLWPPTSVQPLKLIQGRVPFYAAQIDSGTFLLVMLPQGLESTSARFPNLHFIPGDSESFLVPYFERGIAALRDSLRVEPGNDTLERQLAYFLLMHGELAAALQSYARVLSRRADDPEMMFQAGVCEARLGQMSEARAQFERALALALELGDPALARRIQSLTNELPPKP